MLLRINFLFVVFLFNIVSFLASTLNYFNWLFKCVDSLCHKTLYQEFLCLLCLCLQVYSLVYLSHIPFFIKSSNISFRWIHLSVSFPRHLWSLQYFILLTHMNSFTTWIYFTRLPWIMFWCITAILSPYMCSMECTLKTLIGVPCSSYYLSLIDTCCLIVFHFQMSYSSQCLILVTALHNWYGIWMKQDDFSCSQVHSILASFITCNLVSIPSRKYIISLCH